MGQRRSSVKNLIKIFQPISQEEKLARLAGNTGEQAPVAKSTVSAPRNINGSVRYAQKAEIHPFARIWSSSRFPSRNIDLLLNILIPNPPFYPFAELRLSQPTLPLQKRKSRTSDSPSPCLLCALLSSPLHTLFPLPISITRKRATFRPIPLELSLREATNSCHNANLQLCFSSRTRSPSRVGAPPKLSETKPSSPDGAPTSSKKTEIEASPGGTSPVPQTKSRRVSMSKSGSTQAVGSERSSSPSSRRSLPPGSQDLTSSNSTITSLASLEISTDYDESSASQASPEVVKKKSGSRKSAAAKVQAQSVVLPPEPSEAPVEVPPPVETIPEVDTAKEEVLEIAAPTTTTVSPDTTPIDEAPELPETPIASPIVDDEIPPEPPLDDHIATIEDPVPEPTVVEEVPLVSEPEVAPAEPEPIAVPEPTEPVPTPALESPREVTAEAPPTMEPIQDNEDTAATIAVSATASSSAVATASPAKKKRTKKHKDKEDKKDDKDKKTEEKVSTPKEDRKDKTSTPKEMRSKKSKRTMSPALSPAVPAAAAATTNSSPPRIRRPKEKERQTSTLSSSGGSTGGPTSVPPPLSGSLGGSATDKSLDRVEVIGVVEPSAITIVETSFISSNADARTRKRTVHRISAIESDAESSVSGLRDSSFVGTDNSEVLLPSPRSAEFAAVVSPKKGLKKRVSSSRKHAGGVMSPEERANVRRSLSAPINENTSVRRKKRASFHAKSNAKLDNFYPAADSDSESLSLSDEEFTLPSSPNFTSAYDEDMDDGEPWSADAKTAGESAQVNGGSSGEIEHGPSSPRSRAAPTPRKDPKSTGLLIAASSSPSAPVGTSSNAAVAAASSSAGPVPFPVSSTPIAVSSPSKRSKRGPGSPAISPYKSQLQSFFSGGAADKKKKKSSHQPFIEPGASEASIDIWDEPPTSTENLIMEDTTESRTYVNTAEMARKGGGGLFIKSATLNKLIEHLTWVDYNEDDKTYAKIFLSAYESFTSPEVLMVKLIERFHVPEAPVSINGRKPVSIDQWAITAHVIQSRVCSVMKMWIDTFSSSFGPKMTRMFNAFITEELDPIKHRPVVTILTNALEERIHKESSLLQRLLSVTGLNTLSKREAMKKSQSEGNVIPTHQHKLAHAIELLSVEDMAKQLTLGDYFVFNSIKPWELLHHTWDDEIPIASSPLKELVHRFNQISSFVISVILSQRDVKARARLYTKFVKLAKHLFRLNNFNSLMAILGGLNHSCIARLSQTLTNLPRGAAKIIHKLDRFMSVKNNFGRYRERLAELGNQSCVPYLGLVLNDYMFIEESNSAIDNFSERTLLNFSRIKQLYYNCIEPLAQFQGRPYDFTISDPQIERLILSQELLDQNDAYVRSINLEQDAV